MNPHRFTFQWHITNQCNYRCKHCYQTDYNENGKSIDELINFYNKLEEFALMFIKTNKLFKAHINFTGGEPFLKNDFLDLLDYVTSKKVFSIGILSNGYMISDSHLNRLKLFNPQFIQISLDGTQAINDSIRGEGSYLRIIESIKHYKKAKIPVLISFTANSLNYKTFPLVVDIARKYKVDKIWTDRHLPFNNNDNLCLSEIETKEYFEILREAKKRRLPYYFSKTIVSANRALQFLSNGGKPYSCSAGKTLLAIMPNGDIMPCRRMPIVLSNLNTCNLYELYQENDILKKLRDINNLDKECLKCYYKNACNGGLKCLSFAIYKNFHKKDPNCWLNEYDESVNNKIYM